MDKSKKQKIATILKAFCDDKRKQVTPELLLLWQTALEDFHLETLNQAFCQITKQRDRSIGYDISHDEFVEVCRTVRKWKSLKSNTPYNPDQIGQEERKRIEHNNDTEISEKKWEDFNEEIRKNVSVESGETILCKLGITEQMDINGDVQSFCCPGHVDVEKFRNECSELYDVKIKIVRHETGETIAIVDGNKVKFKSNITIGYIEEICQSNR